MLTIALGAYRTFPLDEYGQSSAGWRPGLTDEEVYEAARGRWKLGARADRERYVLFTAMGIVVLAVEIDGVSKADPDGRRTISGAILKPGNPVYDKYVGGEASVGRSQNPVQYFDAPFDRATCACGCGTETPSGRNFVAGHTRGQSTSGSPGSAASSRSWSGSTRRGPSLSDALNLSSARPHRAGLRVLPDRKVATVADWLREHPDVRVVCRDGAGAFARTK